jgi:23S rRNA pseudouridine2457 synthase
MTYPRTTPIEVHFCRSSQPLLYRYLLFYKPYGVLTQFSDRSETDRPTLKDSIDVPGVYPVGRLDRDSEGLLLLTNDGTLQHRLIEPKFAHARTYLVQVERIPDMEAIAKLRQGVEIKNYRTKPARVKLLAQEPDLPPRDPPIRHRLNVPTAWLEMTLREGKNRQVRRMTAAVGFPTLRLVRVAIANLTLSGLQPGQWRDLTKAELKKLKQTAGLL